MRLAKWMFALGLLGLGFVPLKAKAQEPVTGVQTGWFDSDYFYYTKYGMIFKAQDNNEIGIRVISTSDFDTLGWKSKCYNVEATSFGNPVEVDFWLDFKLGDDSHKRTMDWISNEKNYPYARYGYEKFNGALKKDTRGCLGDRVILVNGDKVKRTLVFPYECRAQNYDFLQIDRDFSGATWLYYLEKKSMNDKTIGTFPLQKRDFIKR